MEEEVEYIWMEESEEEELQEAPFESFPLLSVLPIKPTSFSQCQDDPIVEVEAMVGCD